MDEIWKEIPGYAGKYFASSFGRVRASEKRARHCPKGFEMERTVPEKILITNSNMQGYKRTTLTINGNQKFWLVHRIIASTFLPNPDCLPHVNHIDGCKYNNRVENLEWVTHAQNMAHAASLGLTSKATAVGMENNAARITDKCVREIKIRLASGEGRSSIARDYPVSPSAIGQIKAGRTWAHISIETKVPGDALESQG